MSAPSFDIGWLARDYEFKTLIDIGANDGAYAEYLARRFGIERVIAIEPLPKHAPTLRARGFEVHALALGDEDREITFYSHARDPVSSALPISTLCMAEFPDTAERTSIQVPQRKLDTVLKGRTLESALLIKMDAQGVEHAIIDGGNRVFSQASVILTEVSFQPLYEGQSLFGEVHRRLELLGFQFAGFINQQASETTGRPLFAHVVYEKRQA